MRQIDRIRDTTLLRSTTKGVAWPAFGSADANAILAQAYQLERSQWWTTDLLREFQLEQFSYLLSHAVSTVPFYRDRTEYSELLRSAKIDMRNFSQLPRLTRADIQAQGETMASRAVPKSHSPLHQVATSGSTGTPVSIQGTYITAILHRALGIRWNTWHNRNYNSKMAHILTPPPAHPTNPDRSIGWGRGFLSGPLVAIGANQPIQQQIEWLQKEDPGYLATYPSNLQALLKNCAESGTRIANLQEVQTRGEVLDPDVRAQCEAVWGVPVTDSYGANEFGLLAMQCPETHNYHVQAEHLLLEVLNESGGAVSPGEIGRVVVTDLHNFATPLIRYELGDYAQVGAACSCGRGLPTLERVIGRSRNMFMLPSGDRFWPVFSKALAGLQRVVPKLQQAQLVQRTQEEITACVVVGDELNADEATMIKQGLGEALGGVFAIQLEYVKQIKRSPSGKILDAICELNDA